MKRTRKIKSEVEKGKMMDGAEERERTRGAENRGRRMRGDDGGKVKKKCFCKKNKKKTGHLVRWNYISNVHRALMLLSHQHIDRLRCVWEHSNTSLPLKFLSKSKTPYPHCAPLCRKPFINCTAEHVR